jgi:hypothetical protein
VRFRTTRVCCSCHYFNLDGIPVLCRLSAGTAPIAESGYGVSVVRSWGRLLIVVLAAGYLAACTEVVDSVVDSRYGQYNRSTDWAKNEAILLNIARASEFQPLNFLSFQPYTGSATVTGSASSPSFILGPNRIASQKQYTLGSGALTASASGTGTINVTNLDTSDFYDSLLSPVDFTNLNAFQRQGYSRELLFRLFADYVSLKPGIGDAQGPYSVIVYNDTTHERSCFPLRPEVINKLYGSSPQEFQTEVCFRDLVVFALVSGLSSEVRTVTSPDTSAKQPAASTSSTKTTATNSSPPKTQTEARLCFDSALATRAIYEFHWNGLDNLMPKPADLMATQYHPICGGTGPEDIWLPTSQKAPAAPVSAADKAKLAATAKQADAAKTQAATDSANADADAKADPSKAAAATKAKANLAKVTTQAAQADAAANAKPAAAVSPPGVATLRVHVKSRTGFPVWDIHLLGQHVIEIGTRSTFSMYNFLGSLVREPLSDANRWTGPPEDGNDNFIITVNKGQPAGCFAATVLDLEIYCVPTSGAQNTKRTFSILSQLLALKTTTDDLQLTPTLRLLPD